MVSHKVWFWDRQYIKDLAFITREVNVHIRLEAKSEKGPRTTLGAQNVRRCHPCQFTRLTLGEHVLPG